jgi:hypothetical protein
MMAIVRKTVPNFQATKAELNKIVNSKPRNWKMVAINEESIVGLLSLIPDIISAKPDQALSLRLPRINGLPEGYLVRNVAWSTRRHCFLVLIEHPSYEPVPINQEIPVINSCLESYCVTFKLNKIGGYYENDPNTSIL